VSGLEADAHRRPLFRRASDHDGDGLIGISRLFDAGTQVVYSEF
jgi:hypothetical protein